ncbi:low-complexity tail membrane protein [Spirulina sp. CCNP1310]|uniref:low-complexity tail membrane protein n=1 Tax=Spirulina sp. CCNP1310 TaxID=3110249 RepID=UPI002B211FBE|nr:low-complexity tail membrane protein [Spirulina sp. CCNP1310]MEA5418072.1 low-complexity tail membrane protein [Spirulina sp. CCNP1310]
MFRRDPYLWLHLTSLATLPLWLWVAWLGVAAGQPILPVTVEIFLLVTVAVVPWVWLQWTRPVNPFGVWLLVLLPNQLTPVQRQWLTRLKGKTTGILAVIIALPMVWLVGQIYGFAPLAQAVTPVPNHVLGFGLGAIALFCANGMVQVSGSMGALLLTGEAKFTATADYPVAQIRQDFLNIGLPVQRLLPTITPEAVPDIPPSKPSQTAEETVDDEIAAIPNSIESAAVALIEPDPLPDPEAVEAVEAIPAPLEIESATDEQGTETPEPATVEVLPPEGEENAADPEEEPVKTNPDH